MRTLAVEWALHPDRKSLRNRFRRLSKAEEFVHSRGRTCADDRRDPVDPVRGPDAGRERRAERARGVHRRAGERPAHHGVEADGKAHRQPPGAAFGLSLGPHSRWLFTALALVVLVFLWRMYRATPPGDWVQALALGLVSGGAIGNAVNRIWSERGVVDFLDVGIGDARWPTFNVADIAITIGAFLLAWILWREDSGTPDAASASNAGVQ